MASIINASTTSGVVITGDTSGNLSLQTQAGANTITVPNTSGTMMVSGNMPAFSVYSNAQQTVNNGTFTKLSLQVKEFDTSSSFDNSTNYRFTPTVAGYYQINGAGQIATASQGLLVSIYKNGSEYKRGIWFGNVASIGNQSIVSTIVYLNGSTDYIELYMYQASGSNYLTNYGSNSTYLNGTLVRAA